MGADNGWEETPKVRLSVLDPGHKDVVNRVEQEFPLARTEYKKLYLTGGQGLSAMPQPQEDTAAYDTSAKEAAATFTMTFDEDTEITGYMKLHAYVEAAGSNDMELHVQVEKLDGKGNPIPDRRTRQPIVAEGYLRVSQRALDEARSTDIEPVLKHDHEDLLKKGEIVPVDIPIWPMGMKYHAGEKIRLTVKAYNPPSPDTVPAFGAAKITVPENGYTYEPGTKVPMKTVGGMDGKNYVENVVKAPRTRNKGKHIIHLGGRYGSYLQVPVVPEK